MPLTFAERPARADPAGLLVLHHGRGSDEQDLIGLAPVLDPEERLHVVAPRAPLQLGGSPGYHWYLVPRVGYPDPDTFHAAYRELASFHDELWQRTGIGPERTVLGGFSMGTVMSYALGLGGDRPAPAGILALSGFIPTVEGWQPSLEDRRDTKILIAHGRNDPVIPVTFARARSGAAGTGGVPRRLPRVRRGPPRRPGRHSARGRLAGRGTPKRLSGAAGPAPPRSSDSALYQRVGCPVLGSRNNVPSSVVVAEARTCCPASPPMASNDWSPIPAARCQLSSMNCRIEDWSVSVWSTSWRVANGEITSSGWRGP